MLILDFVLQMQAATEILVSSTANLSTKNIANLCWSIAVWGSCGIAGPHASKHGSSSGTEQLTAADAGPAPAPAWEAVYRQLSEEIHKPERSFDVIESLQLFQLHLQLQLSGRSEPFLQQPLESQYRQEWIRVSRPTWLCIAAATKTRGNVCRCLCAAVNP